MTFCVWLLPLGITFSRSVHVVLHGSISFLLMAILPLHGFASLLMQSSVGGTFGFFLFLALMANAAMNISCASFRAEVYFRFS